jgi:putative restriction endonuclease
VTVTPSLELRVSRRIREEFENGRDYYALEGASVRMPLPPAPPPLSEYLEWHGDTLFRGWFAPATRTQTPRRPD